MIHLIGKNPFAVETFFEKSIVLTFAVPKEQLESLLPKCLTLDTFNDTWAFIAVALVDTVNLRPKGLPAFMGKDFFLIGYRVFVRYTNNKGKNLRGLYILRSETNKKSMELFGNIFTRYKYSTTDIRISKTEKGICIISDKSCLKIVYNDDSENIELPSQSPFPDWKQARRFAGPLPFTFSFNEQNNEVSIVEGVRSNWIPKPVQVEEYSIPFLQQSVFENAILASAFSVSKIPYWWKKGVTESWKGKESRSPVL